MRHSSDSKNEMQPQCKVVAPLFLRYEKELLGFLRKRLSDEAESEEILRSVLLKVYSNCEKVPSVTHLRGWLFQITRNALADYYREKGKVHSLPETWDSEEDPATPLYLSLEPLLPAMISILPKEYAVPLQLCDLDGLPQKEVAKQLGLSLTATKSRIQRAREKLKALFFECCYMELDGRGVPVSAAVKPSCGPLSAFQNAGQITPASKWEEE